MLSRDIISGSILPLEVESTVRTKPKQSERADNAKRTAAHRRVDGANKAKTKAEPVNDVAVDHSALRRLEGTTGLEVQKPRGTPCEAV